MSNSGRTLRLFLADGTPAGIIVGEIINWTGRVTKVPRSFLATFVTRPDSARTGAYLLMGDDSSLPGRKRIYVGESDNVGSRLKQHASSPDKDFWDVAYVVTSKDDNLTKSHALFLEARMLLLAQEADRVTVENNRLLEYTNIPESDKSDMTYFCDQIELLLPTLGADVFSTAVPSSVSSQLAGSNVSSQAITDASFPGRASSIAPSTGPSAIDIILNDPKFGIQATGREYLGAVVVSKGSTARGENNSEVNTYGALRKHLIESGKLVATADPKVLLFADDVQFDSPSAASAVILDRNDNGRASWKERQTGKSLNRWYADQAAESSPSGAIGDQAEAS